MKTLLPLIAALCILGANGFVSPGWKRERRDVDVRPIDCLLSRWSEWGPCNACAKERYRSRSVVRFGQYGGKPCIEALGDRQFCQPDTPCPEELPDCGNGFMCENGHCIKKRLVCNTEDDCGDFSDEDNCEGDPRAPCRDRIIDVSEVGRTAGRGVNILGMEPKESPFYNEFYNGVCDRVRDGNTGIYYRKPWNVAVLNYDTKGDKRFRNEVYENQVTAVKEMFSERHSSAHSSFSLKLTPTEVGNGTSVGFSLSTNTDASSNETLHKFLKDSKGKHQIFFHVKGNIELGTFQMRRRDVRLTDTFLEDVKYLPSAYDKGEYFKFLEMHGTHFAQKGTVGGKYELMYVLDNQTMSSEGVTVEDVKACLGYNTDFGLTAGTFEVKHTDKGNDCKSSKIRNKGNTNNKGIIHNVISLVHGGKTEVLVRLKEKLSRGHSVVDVEDYVQWAATLSDAPTVIQYEPYPISTLIPVTIPNSTVKKQNLDRAVEDYVAEYSVCKCQPCQNGGTVMLLNGRCECGCTPYFKGEACQIPSAFFSPVATGTDGGWSCWSTWSACVQGERTRRRQCNNPEAHGGKDCAGADSESGYCAADIK
ncbi:complement component C9 isoform X1 [Podarcis raffonei]|uniref:complement component C9 isoform X1 n=1 Tax=Podarcis raffonei TaxID=65483 RepID=UPI0023293F29|nr:complement component C9 isoform X1 [Podarcis raffonei]